MRFRPALYAAVVALCCAASAAKDIALISNKENTVRGVPFAELVKICKGQTARWPDGKFVTLVMRSPGSTDMKIVLQKAYGMTSEEVNQLLATANHGRTDRPAVVVVSSDEAVVKKVESMPGSVGLVDVYSITGGVNVIKVGGKFPLEPGYVLHGN